MRFVMMCLIVLLAPMTLGGVIYVDADATGTNDGGSWENAFVYLQDALAVAGDGDEIRVAQGLYKPDLGAGIGTGDRNATFQLKNGVGLYGGFPSGGGTWEDRDPNAFETTLSGDLGNNDADVDITVMLTEPTRAENSLHVVTGSGTDATAVLDGFTTTAGHASGVTSFVWEFNEGAEWPWYDYSYNWDEFHLYGAGMFNYSGSPTVTNCTFVKNAAICGGGMGNHEGSQPIVTNCSFSRNIAGWGAGIQNALGSSPTLHACTFSDNVAGSSSLLGESGTDSLLGVGAAFASAVRCDTTLTECTFTGNRAVLHEDGDVGGAICEQWGCTTLVDQCVFIGNSASWGGALFLEHGSYTVRNCTVRDNTSANRGGAVHSLRNDSTLLENCDFHNNSAKWGGALSGHQGVLTVTHSTFSGNTVTRWGGAIYNYSGVWGISNCVFTNNSADEYGGAIECRGGYQTLTGCTFTDNTATLDGGAVDSTNSDSQFTNCIFSANSSPEGGAVWTGNYGGGTGSCVLTNCTLVDNDTYGIYISNINPTLENCIVWGNTPSQFFGSAGVTYSDVEGGYTGVGNINLAPAFVRRDNGDYHLRSLAGAWDESTQSWVPSDRTSPCIDMGNPLSDYSAELWPHGGRINMGAYGGTAEASMSSSDIGNIADYNNDDGVDYADFSVLSGEWQSDVLLSKADMNRDGHVGMEDLLIFANNW